MHALTVSEARANLYRLIDETAESHEPIIISGKRSMRESIKTGMAEPLATSAKALKW